jgi:hypothetical protein
MMHIFTSRILLMTNDSTQKYLNMTLNYIKLDIYFSQWRNFAGHIYVGNVYYVHFFLFFV